MNGVYFKIFATPEFLQVDRAAPAYGSLLQLHHTPIYHILSKLFPVPKYRTNLKNYGCTFNLKKIIIFFFQWHETAGSNRQISAVNKQVHNLENAMFKQLFDFLMTLNGIQTNSILSFHQQKKMGKGKFFRIRLYSQQACGS